MRLKSFLFAISLIVILVIAVILQTSEQSSAQNEPIPLPGTLPPNPLAGQEYKVWGDPANYQIVYFVAPGAIPEGNITSPRNLLGQITQAKIAYKWDDVIGFDVQKPIEALIVHKSAYELVDKNWTAAAARRGVVIATINMYAAEQAELRNSNCDRQNPKQSPFKPEQDYFLVAVYLIQTENPADLDRILEGSYANCKIGESTGRIYESSRGTHLTLGTEDEVEALTNSLIGAIDLVRDAKENFANLSMSPTLPPEFGEPQK